MISTHIKTYCSKHTDHKEVDDKRDKESNGYREGVSEHSMIRYIYYTVKILCSF